jgi:hypothetical protein
LQHSHTMVVCICRARASNVGAAFRCQKCADAQASGVLHARRTFRHMHLHMPVRASLVALAAVLLQIAGAESSASSCCVAPCCSCAAQKQQQVMPARRACPLTLCLC